MVPVKRAGAAKSRLRGRVPGVPHEELALAMAPDTVAAALACPAVGRVLVVTDDPAVAAAAGARRRAGACRTSPDAGLNAAFRHGARPRPPPGWVAGLTADLPALRPAELAARAARGADRPAGGTRGSWPTRPARGTVLLAAPPGVPLDPRFGPGSAAAHAAQRRGAARPATGRACAATWTPPPTWPPPPARARAAHRRARCRRPADRPARRCPARRATGRCTVLACRARWPASTRRRAAASLLLDDGTELRFPAPAFDASGLRLLRLGQRVRLEHDADGEVVRVTLPTMA